MAEFTEQEWQQINTLLQQAPEQFGLPKREYGSVILASFNIRKLGAKNKRSESTWKFLAHICKQFDLISIQEIMDNLEGFNYLKELMGPEFGAVVSDKTGTFPGESGVGERLGFIFNWSVVQRGPIVSDISSDRTRLLETLARHKDEISEALTPLADFLAGKLDKRPTLQLPVFLSFIRQPFYCTFKIVGHPGTEPYDIVAINAHLYYGNSFEDRRQEFDALIEWIKARVREGEGGSYPSYVLMGDLNLKFNQPEKDRETIEQHIKTYDDALGKAINVYFPFLDAHPNHKEPFRTNARLDETFDQIGLFSRDPRLPLIKQGNLMGKNQRGPDYGVFNFVELFRQALGVPPLKELTAKERREFYAKFEHEVSDHLPLWLRLPLPDQ